jgi:hypothetical protein
MRSIFLTLALAVALVLPLQAQQSPSLIPAGQPAAEVQSSSTSAVFPAAPAVASWEEAHLSAEESAVRQASARNFFAIIGVVVVAVALITMFR